MMTKKTLHWILGLLVSVSLVVISMPLWVGHQRKGLENPLRSVPPFPDETEQVLPDLSKPNPQSLPDKQKVSLNAVTLQIEKNVATEIKKQLLSHQNWAVDVGHFNNKLNALKLLDTLRVNGFPAFMQQTPNADIQIYIGPALKKSEASVLADQLNIQLNLRSTIVNYQPLVI